MNNNGVFHSLLIQVIKAMIIDKDKKIFRSKFLTIVFLERTIVHFGEEKVLQFLVKEWIIRKYNSIQMNLFRS